MIKGTLLSSSQYFKERKVTIDKAIAVLAKSNISVNEEEAAIILNFLYLIAGYSKQPGTKVNEYLES